MTGIQPMTVTKFLLRGLICSLFFTGSVALAGTVQYSYDTLGRLVGVTNANGSVVTYTYDAAGNRASPGGGGNRPPVANNISVPYTQVSPPYGPWMAIVDVRSYDSDPDGDTLTVTSVGTASGCSITASGPVISFMATASPRVTCSVPYTISDGHGHTASAAVTVHP